MKISHEEKLDYSDVLIVPQRSKLKSRSEVSLIRQYSFPNSPLTWNGIGIIAANMDTVGTIEMAKNFYENKMLVALHKHYSIDVLFDFFQNVNYWNCAFYTVGTSNEDREKLNKVKSLLEKKLGKEESSIFPKFLCIDIANGYSEHFLDTLKSYRKDFPESIIMAGNICTENMAEELILSGADICKIGIGPGAVCTTRVKTGVGYPQLSAVSECAHAAHGLRGHCCADGGITSTGDIAKALAAGGDFVMIGSLIAGVDECEGSFINEYNKDIPYATLSKITMLYSLFKNNDYLNKFDGSEFFSTWKKHYDYITDLDIEGFLLHFGFDTSIKVDDFIKLIEDKVIKRKFQYYGMSSFEAQKKHIGVIRSHRTAEGKVVTVDAKGPVDGVIQDIKGGIRSTCTYIGAKTIKDLPKCARFVRVKKTHNVYYGDNWRKS